LRNAAQERDFLFRPKVKSFALQKNIFSKNQRGWVEKSPNWVLFDAVDGFAGGEFVKYLMKSIRKVDLLCGSGVLREFSAV